MTRYSRALPALAGAAALTIGGISPAAAAQWVHDDPSGDVVSYSYDSETGTETGPDARPGNTTSDITQFAVNHTARRVAFETTLRDITAGSGVMVYEIRTDARTYWAHLMIGGKRQTPMFDLSRPNGRTVRCDGARRSVDRTIEQAAVSIPRGCLDGPRWVRVGAGAVDFAGDINLEKIFIDDGLKDGFTEDDLTLSPRVPRG